MKISHVSAKWFQQRLLHWFSLYGRRDLPWKKPLCPYRIWVSEIMLQQTQVTTAIPFFERFMQTFPTVEKLAASSLDDVLLHWAGLGYYARARNLHRTAVWIVKENQGKFPADLDSLVALPGIGRSTAGAILAQAFNIHAPILDGNVKRVLCRFHCIPGNPYEKKIEQYLWELAQFFTSYDNPADYTQAIMDLGATCCTRTRPTCSLCPLHSRCQAYASQTQTRYPIKKIKKNIPTRYTFMLIAKNAHHAFLFEQRPLRGIWAGLWSFPEFASQDALAHFLQTSFKHKKTAHLSSVPLPLLPHTFTHFHLHIQPILVTLPAYKTSLLSTSFTWLNIKQLESRGVPAPVKKLLLAAQKAI